MLSLLDREFPVNTDCALCNSSILRMITLLCWVFLAAVYIVGRSLIVFGNVSIDLVVEALLELQD